jgi:hypothetical protein
MTKKSLLTILIILSTTLLIAAVIWIFNHRIKNIEEEMQPGIIDLIKQ